MHRIEIDSVIKDSLKELDLSDFLTVSFFIIDEIYKQVQHLVIRSGPTATFSDSEVICLNLVGQMVCDSEKAWHKMVKKNYISLFPKLLERSRYHRRCKDLQQLTEIIRQRFLYFMDNHLQKWFIMDSMPVPVCVYARASRNLRFATDFGVDNDSLYGYCASKKEDIYGFKLHLMTSTQGIPTHYVLAPASHHDVTIAP
jgi:Transposase DDE domain